MLCAVHTARTRLVREKAPPFGIWTEKLFTSTEKSPFLFDRFPGEVRISSEPLPAYWELDPCWDGKTFHSYAQALLPLRDGDLPRSLPLPPHSGTICLRVVTPAGEQTQIVLEPAS